MLRLRLALRIARGGRWIMSEADRRTYRLGAGSPVRADHGGEGGDLVVRRIQLDPDYAGHSYANGWETVHDRLATADANRSEWLRQKLKPPDPDELDLLPSCFRCGTEITKDELRRTPYRRLCGTCTRAGWRPKSCVVCGGPTQRWNHEYGTDKYGDRARKTRNGWCTTCRTQAAKQRELG